MLRRIKTLSFVIPFGVVASISLFEAPRLSAAVDPFGGWLDSETIDPRPAQTGPARTWSFWLLTAPADDGVSPVSARLAGAIAAAAGRDHPAAPAPDSSWRLAAFDVDAILGKLRSSLFAPAGEREAPAEPSRLDPTAGKVTLDRVIAEPSAEAPWRVSSLTVEPAKAVALPRSRHHLHGSQRAPSLAPPRQRLRPFNARALGIEVTPGSSADSLARALEAVSQRAPAAPGFGPALSREQRSIPFERVLGGRGGALTKN